MEEPLKILVVAACPFPAERGTPVRIRRLCEGLDKRRHRVEIATYHIGDPVDFSGITVHRTAADKNYTHTGPGPNLKKLLVLDRRLAQRLVQLLKTEVYDVVYAHHVEGLLVSWTARRLAQTAVPIVFDCHTSLEAELPYYAPRIGKALARWAGGRLDRVLPSLADHTTTVTEELQAQILAQKVVREEQITVIGNGLELDIFERAAVRNERTERGKALVFAGNLAGYQGIELMLDAFKLVLERCPEARLNIVSQDSFDGFEARCRDMNIRHAIDVDLVSFEDVPACLNRADVALNPRLDAPGLPLKTLNYLAVGLPIVSFAGSGHHLTDGENALLVENGDIDGFAGAIVRLLDDEALARTLSDNGRNLIQEKVSWERSTAALERVLRATARKPAR